MTGVSFNLEGNFFEHEELLNDEVWTTFRDAFTGGRLKIPGIECVIIQGNKEQAIKLFQQLIGMDPLFASCDCDICNGPDYSVIEYEGLFQATGRERNCFWDIDLQLYLEETNGESLYIPLEDHLNQLSILVILEDGRMSQNISLKGESKQWQMAM